MSYSLAQWNEADSKSALCSMIACCGAHRWAAAMIAHRPIASEVELHDLADRLWNTMQEPDWMEAFACHPRIGERGNPHSAAQSSTWSEQEQSSTQTAAEAIMAALAEGNARYQDKFGFTYIICATGKGAEEMLAIL